MNSGKAGALGEEKRKIQEKEGVEPLAEVTTVVLYAP